MEIQTEGCDSEIDSTERLLCKTLYQTLMIASSAPVRLLILSSFSSLTCALSWFNPHHVMCFPIDSLWEARMSHSCQAWRQMLGQFLHDCSIWFTAIHGLLLFCARLERYDLNVDSTSRGVEVSHICHTSEFLWTVPGLRDRTVRFPPETNLLIHIHDNLLRRSM